MLFPSRIAQRLHPELRWRR